MIKPLVPMLCSLHKFSAYALLLPSVVWPGEYLELDIIPSPGRWLYTGTSTMYRHPYLKAYETCPHLAWNPNLGSCWKICLVNTSNEPQAIGCNEHLSQILPTIGVPSPTPSLTPTNQQSPMKPKCLPTFSSAVSVDPDNLLPDQSCLKYQQLLQEYNCIFDPKITGWNGVAGPIQATVNIGPM